MAFYEPQWAVVGDTFVCGAAFAPSIVYRSSTFEDNPDLKDRRYNTENGIYSPKCGLDHVTMSWGHDEYLYRVLRNHGTTLPDEALYMIRYWLLIVYFLGKTSEELLLEKCETKFKRRPACLTHCVYKSVIRFGIKLKNELIMVRNALKLGSTGGVNNEAKLAGIPARVLNVCPILSNCLSSNETGAAWLRAKIKANTKMTA